MGHDPDGTQVSGEEQHAGTAGEIVEGGADVVDLRGLSLVIGVRRCHSDANPLGWWFGLRLFTYKVPENSHFPGGLIYLRVTTALLRINRHVELLMAELINSSTISSPPQAHFTVLGKDGKLHEADFKKLQEWAHKGRISASYQVYSHQKQQWLYAEEIPGIKSIFQRVRARESLHVVVTDVEMPIGSMFVFMVKWAIASIPAAIIIAIFAAIIMGVLGEILA